MNKVSNQDPRIFSTRLTPSSSHGYGVWTAAWKSVCHPRLSCSVYWPVERMLTQSHSNDLCSPANNFSGLDQPLSLESLSSLFTRLILQNHLTRLAGDTLGLGGRGVWSCSVPTPSCSQPNACLSSSSSPSNCPTHRRGCGQQRPSCGMGNNMCGHTNNNINICHTCPAATVPYMTSNNVFVIPAFQQQHPGAVGSGYFGSSNLNHNNLNNSGLGNGLSGVGGGMGGLAMNTGNTTFSCRGCGLQM